MFHESSLNSLSPDKESYFPLLRLPILAQIEVVKSMNPMEILHLARTSEKFRRYMRTQYRLSVTISISCIGPSKSFKCFFSGKENSMLYIKVQATGKENGNSSPWNFGSKSIPTSRYMDYEYCLFTYWGVDGTDEWHTNFVDFFNDAFDVRSVSLNIRGPLLEYQMVLDHIQTRGLKIETLDYYSDSYDESTVNRFLTEAINAENLAISLPHYEGQLQFNRFNEYSLNKLAVEGAAWMTIEHLCSLINCQEIMLLKVRLSSQDVNLFLKHFMENPGRVISWSSDWKLYSWGLNVFEYDLNVVLDGVDCVKTGDSTWLLQTKDGRKFDFKCQDGEFSLNVRPE